jgi:hypothetical protein
MKYYFSSDRLEMGAFGRFIVRFCVYVFYGALVSSTVVALFSELKFLNVLGIFFTLFLLDRCLHLNHGKEPLYHIPKKERVNLADYLAPSSFTVIEKSLEKSSFIGGLYVYWLIRQILETPEAYKALEREGLPVKDYLAKAINKIKEGTKEKEDKASKIVIIETVVAKAKEIAEGRRVNYIFPEDIFHALMSRSLNIGTDIFNS